MTHQKYCNPVYAGYFADPFVWRHEGRYYAIGTGPVRETGAARDDDPAAYTVTGEERAFPLLVSDDFAGWTFLGGALKVPAFARGGAFWAPETAFDGNHFYLYYSVSTEGLNHRLRVASSLSPAGPYEDIGPLMNDHDPCPFAIDPHPFRDADGTWYLFYARDFLDEHDGFRAGTGIVVDRLNAMASLAGEPQTVARARSDWQRFRANRHMYGQTYDWHTVEGPCVRKHNGLYHCFYSGGCFENESYGVDYAVARHILGPYDDGGNEAGPRVMRTVPDKVIGPGHHSIVIGPDGAQEYLAYHAWDPEMQARRFFLDRLNWTEEGPRCHGPTWTSQDVANPLPRV